MSFGRFPSTFLLVVACAMASVGCSGGDDSSGFDAGIDAFPEAGSDGGPTLGCAEDKDCGQGLSCCNTVCVDTKSDTSHCGHCGSVCAQGLGLNGTATCTSGTCKLTCSPGFADCDHVEDNGCEVDLQSAPEHCGACGTLCLFAHGIADCQASQCVLKDCASGFGDCNKNAMDGCEADLSNDPLNCVKCGAACTSTASACGTGSQPACNSEAACSAGVCGAGQCLDGFADCNKNASDGCETDILTDSNNCGSCETVCTALAHATAACAGAACSVGACDMGWGDCNKSAFDGCESNLSMDSANCNGCGNKCPAPPNGVSSCTGGVCAVGGCAAGFADCNGDPNDGCEVNLGTDPANCGACTNACPTVINGHASCTDFQCGIGTCDGSYAHCFGTVSSCETDLSSSVDHCSSCGNICPFIVNGTRACTANTCGIGACTTGFGDCNSDASDGCETNLSNTVTHCGTCTNACPSPPNGVATCATGACALASCHAGFSDCDNNPANGCERNTLVDPRNCGGCGITCGSGTCTNSLCACNSTVLVIADDSSGGTATLVGALRAANLTVTQTAVPSYQYTGSNPSPMGFGAIVLLSGGPAATSYTTDMPMAGQTAIASFVQAGNGLVMTEWATLHVANGQWQTLAPYVLLTRTSAYSGQVTYQVDAAFLTHPVWAGLPAQFTFASTSNVGITRIAPGVSRIAGSTDAIDAVAILDSPVGRAVHLAHAGNFDPAGWTNLNIQALMVNAVGWASRCK